MTALENVIVGRHSRMRAGLFGSIARTPGVRARGAGGARAGARAARLRRGGRETGRRAGDQPVLRRPAARGDRPGAGLRPAPAAARRADGGDEPAGVRPPDRLHAPAARRARPDDPPDRARHEGRDGRVRADHRAQLRRDDRRGQARRRPRRPRGDRGLPGRSRNDGAARGRGHPHQLRVDRGAEGGVADASRRARWSR